MSTDAEPDGRFVSDSWDDFRPAWMPKEEYRRRLAAGEPVWVKGENAL